MYRIMQIGACVTQQLPLLGRRGRRVCELWQQDYAGGHGKEIHDMANHRDYAWSTYLHFDAVEQEG